MVIKTIDPIQKSNSQIHHLTHQNYVQLRFLYFTILIIQTFETVTAAKLKTKLY